MSARRLLGGALVASLVLPLLAAGALGEGASSGEVQSSAVVLNDPPSNARVDLSRADAEPALPGVQVAPVPGQPTSVRVVAQVEDGNGWKDLEKGSFEIVAPDGKKLESKIDATPAPEGNGKRREFSADFTIEAMDPPGAYTVRFVAADRHDATAKGEAVVEHLGLLALSLDRSALSFGSAIGPGADTHASPAALGVTNTGNVRLDLFVSATPLRTADGSASIGPERIRVSLDPQMGGETPLSGSGVRLDGFDLVHNQARSVYFDLHMPTGEEQYIPAARYTGSITLGGVKG